MLSAVARMQTLRSRFSLRGHWPVTLGLGTVAVLAISAALSTSTLEPGGGRVFARPALPLPTGPALPAEAPPAPEPLAFKAMTPENALAYNASIPISDEPNPAARSFQFKAASDVDRARSIDCLTSAIYYEAGSEPEDGQRAVAQVVLNRVRHPAFPKTVCGVVFQGSDRSTGCQFTFTCDGSLARIPSKAGWARARKIAEEALDGKVYKPVGYATHYHTNWVVPYWSASLTKLANVGTHIFYRWSGGWGRPPAFRYAATGVEPRIALIRHLTSVAADREAIVLDGAALAEAAGEAGAPGATADMSQRQVLRRYEPLREQAAAAARAELARAEVPIALRWSLTGDAGSAKAEPFGRRKAVDAEKEAEGAPAPATEARTVIPAG